MQESQEDVSSTLDKEEEASEESTNLLSAVTGRENPLIYAEFTDAYSFRTLIEYLDHTNDDGNFIFGPKAILYCRESDSRQVLNVVEIYGHELTRYDYNSQQDRFISGLNLAQFKAATRKIGKKDVARLSVFNSAVCLQVNGSPKSGSDDDMDVIRTQRLNQDVFEIDGYQGEDEPNCAVSMARFTSVCGVQASCKDDHVTFIGIDHGIITEARQGGNLRASVKPLGQIDETTEVKGGNLSEKIVKMGEKNIKLIHKYPNEIVRYKIPRRIVSALSKLTNISPNGTVKIYIQPNLPIKLVFHISTYGRLTVYLR